MTDPRAAPGIPEHLVPERPIVVQLSLRPPDGTTQFVDLLLEGAPEAVDYRFFSWKSALLGRYDVLHVHWPELMIRDSASRLRAFVKRRLLDLLLVKVRMRSIPVVRTFHNPRPHEKGTPAETRSLDRFDRATTLFIVLDGHVRPAGRVEVTTIAHGHYIEAFRRYARPPRVEGRVLYFGIIRPYKNVEALTAAFRELPDQGLSLHVVGDPHPGQRAALEASALADPRIALDLRYVDDEALVREVSEASLVVLPYVEMKNSGALLVALSLGTPALVSSSPINDAIAAEVGREWVRTYDGPLTAGILAAHLAAVSGSPPPAPPELSGRDWSTIGAAHLAAYRRAMDLAASRTGAEEPPVRAG
ncbi:glycosyltransferase [Microbacterium pumilum]|uniref:GDP-mannose--glycolipid 4-beta-D-mannosyltransferase n=1 Tax=Microbacterium pumilum TaxID=344165 RepID=A0ABN2S994_9MICO